MGAMVRFDHVQPLEICFSIPDLDLAKFNDGLLLCLLRSSPPGICFSQIIYAMSDFSITVVDIVSGRTEVLPLDPNTLIQEVMSVLLSLALLFFLNAHFRKLRLRRERIVVFCLHS